MKMKQKILILEDNFEMRTFLNMYFKTEFDIITAVNISDAINYIESHKNIKLIISDINLNLGDVTGYDFIDYIKTSELYKHIPIIILSAKDSTEDKIKAFKKNISDYVTKPFNPEELYYRIKNVLKLNI